MVKCHGCGLRFLDKDVKAAHYGINAYLRKEGRLGKAASATTFYLCCLYYNCK